MGDFRNDAKGYHFTFAHDHGAPQAADSDISEIASVDAEERVAEHDCESNEHSDTSPAASEYLTSDLEQLVSDSGRFATAHTVAHTSPHQRIFDMTSISVTSQIHGGAVLGSLLEVSVHTPHGRVHS
jgi:hypothetical protein